MDHTLYLAAAADTIRAVRGHASKLLYCMGNELWPVPSSPPPDIQMGLLSLFAQLDPDPTPVVHTSMGSDSQVRRWAVCPCGDYQLGYSSGTGTAWP